MKTSTTCACSRIQFMPQFDLHTREACYSPTAPGTRVTYTPPPSRHRSLNPEQSFGLLFVIAFLLSLAVGWVHPFGNKEFLAGGVLCLGVFMLLGGDD